MTETSAEKTEQFEMNDSASKTAPDTNTSAFKSKLSQENLDFFNSVIKKPFSEQAIAFLNAYWEELGDQAEFIFEVSFEFFKKSDMHENGLSLIHLYEEGNELNFNIALYFFEQICKFLTSGSKESSKWTAKEFSISQPKMQTAIVRKKELREKVDVNFDGKMSFLEFLLYQYDSKASPAEFSDRSRKMKSEHPEVLKAKDELKQLNENMKAIEKERKRLTDLVEKGGVKGMSAKHELAILDAGSMAQELDSCMISTEALLRKVSKEFKEGVEKTPILHGTMFWMEKELAAKKKLYGKRTTKK